MCRRSNPLKLKHLIDQNSFSFRRDFFRNLQNAERYTGVMKSEAVIWMKKLRRLFYPVIYSHRTLRSREFFIFKWSVIYRWVSKTNTSFEYSFKKKNLKNMSTPIEFFRDYGKFKNQLNHPEIRVHINHFVWSIE